MTYSYCRMSEDDRKMVQSLGLRSDRGHEVNPSSWVYDSETGSYLVPARYGLADEREDIHMYFSYKNSLTYLRLRTDGERDSEGNCSYWWKVRDFISSLPPGITSEEWISNLRLALISFTRRTSTETRVTLDI